MMNCIHRISLIAALLPASFAFADIVEVQFDTVTGNLGGNNHTYSLDSIDFSATALNGGNLFGKNSYDDKGLGLADGADHEINAGGTQQFVQFDLLPLINAGLSSFAFRMSSVERGEEWRMTACSVAGTQGFGVPCSANGANITGTGDGFNLVPSDFGLTNHYVDISAVRGNILVGALSVDPVLKPPVPEHSVPEPGFGLFLAGCLIVASIIARRIGMAG
jgi:hypothetical protein